MRQIGILMACGAMMLAVGCDDGRGGPDAGGIVLMDSGPRVDSGPVGTDSGPTPTGCSVAGATGIPPLPAACLPRCSAATLSAVMACTDAACQNAAIAADTTPPTTIDYGGGMTDSLNCDACFNWQLNSCIFDACPTELGACLMCADRCDPMMTGCETEEGAFNTCLTTNMTGIQTCINGRAGACFSTTSGFLPSLDGPRAQFRMDPALLQRIWAQIPASFPR